MNRNKKTLLAGTLSALLLVFGVTTRVPLFDLAVHAGSRNAVNPLPLVNHDSSLARAERSHLTVFACVNNPIVTTSADSGAGSLRQAIIDACTGSTVTFDMTPGKVTSPITLTSDQLFIGQSLTIQGPGANLLTISGNNSVRVFEVNVASPGAVTFSGVTISNGKADNNSGGAGIRNLSSGTINVTTSTVSGNSSPGSGGTGGGIDNDTTGTLNVTNSTISGNSARFGGGIINGSGTVNLSNSTLSGNSSQFGGGGIFNASAAAIINVTNSTISSNSTAGVPFGGGGICNIDTGPVRLRNSIVALNTSPSGPDLIGPMTSQGHNLIGKNDGSTGFTAGTTQANGDLVGTNAAALDPRLGSLAHNGGPTQTLALLPGSPAMDAGDNCVVTNICSPALGFSLTTDQRGPGFTRQSDGNSDGSSIVDIGSYEGLQPLLVTNLNDSGPGSLRQAITSANVNVDLDTINFQDGLTGTITLVTALPDLSTSMSINGPGANVLTVQRSAAQGTPLFSLFSIAQNVTVTISGLTLSNADSPQNGGAIRNSGALTLDGLTLSNNHTTAGGSAILNGGTGTVTLTNSTVSSNRSDILAAIYNQGGIFNLTNSTLTGNMNQGDAPGTAIFSESISVTNVTNCTISQNTGQSVAVFQNNGGTGKVNLKNSIVSNNTGGNVSGITNNGNNLIGGNPMLAPLGNYGGPTQTMALLPASPAIDAGDNCVVTNTCTPTLATAITTDQRGTGFSRMVNSTVDIGAFESRGFTISATSGTPQSAVITTSFAAPLVATVTGASGEPVAGGIVTFNTPASGPSAKFTGNVTTFNATINASGQANATPTANGLAGGPYNVTASSNGVASATSFSLTNTKAATTTALSSSLNPSNLAQSVTFTATVTSAAGTPTGTAQFKDNGTNLGSPMTLNASGMAQLTTSSLTAGTHTITADYSGDGNFTSSTGTLSGGQVVNNRPLFSFSSATYSVNESTGFIIITVNRTGDTSVAAAVDYATNDTGAPASCATVNGLASSRCDFTTAIGTLKFAAGEAQKTVTVLVNGDSYVEGPETFTVNLSNPAGGAGLITPSSATVTITDGPTGPPANLIDDARFFVRQHYHDFLNREPDQSGWDFWTNNINNCTPQPSCTEIQRINTSAAYFISIEFQQTGYLVERMYKAAYGDASGMSTVGGAHQLNVPIVRFIEFLPDTQKIGQGVIVGQTGWEIVLESNKQAFALEFVQRARFTSALSTSITPAQFVNQLFINAGVTPSATDRQTAINEFGSATNTSDVSARGRALRDVAENSMLTQQEFNRAFVLMQYFGYLRRNPNDPPDSDYSGYDFWLAKLNLFNGNYVSAEMVKAFITSAEYRGRFGL